MKLPLFITKENKVFTGLISGIILYLSYAIPNHNHLYEPQLLPMSAFDRWVPLVPWTVFIYLGEFPLFGTAFLRLNHEANRNRFIYGLAGVVFPAMLIFIFWPTTYPRAEYPLPMENINWFVHLTFTWLRKLDNAANSFPSLHVGCCYLSAFAFLAQKESRKDFVLYFLWATAIAISTLTTKQHYFIDIIGGLILAITSYIIFFKLAKYVPLEEFRKRFLQSTASHKQG